MRNHFEILGLEAHYAINLDALQRAYLLAQQRSHPDRQAGKSAEEKQKAALTSAAANDAYRVLKDDYLRAVHLLELQNIYVQGDQANVKAEAALLMEVMEWNEAAETGDAEEKQRLKGQLQADYADIIEALKQELEPQQVIRLGYMQKTLNLLSRKG